MAGPEQASNTSAGEYSRDDDDQLQAEDTLVDRGVDDVLDEGYSPPEFSRGPGEFGTTVSEQRRGESLDRLLSEEEPDPTMEINDPSTEAEQERSDEAEEEIEFPRGEEVGTTRTGRLVAPDEGVYEDTEADLLAHDVGIDAGAASAEEAAVHRIDE